MKLFLCSHFSSVGSLIKEEIENKKVVFIPTASLREGYTGYVCSSRSAKNPSVFFLDKKVNGSYFINSAINLNFQISLCK